MLIKAVIKWVSNIAFILCTGNLVKKLRRNGSVSKRSTSQRLHNSKMMCVESPRVSASSQHFSSWLSERFSIRCFSSLIIIVISSSSSSYHHPPFAFHRPLSPSQTTNMQFSIRTLTFGFLVCVSMLTFKVSTLSLVELHEYGHTHMHLFPSFPHHLLLLISLSSLLCYTVNSGCKCLSR